MNWLYYLMEANLYLGIFYLCYCLFLNRETHYTLNRIYLLFSCLAAFVLPILQLGILKPAAHVATPIAYTYITYQTAPAIETKPVLTWDDYLVYTYIIGAGIFLALLLFKLYRLARLAYVGVSTQQSGYHLVQLDESNTAFSFFKYLFIGTGPQSADTIIRHELVHIRQRHSIDILFIEVLKVVNWFNPILYLVQRSMRTVHEYIADEQTASAGHGALAYSSFLVENAYGMNSLSVTHSFFNYNLLKKRIIMLHQKRSGKLARLKYLLTVPVCAGLLCVSTLAFSKSYGFDLLPGKTDPANTPRRYDVWNKSTDKVFTTSKGYKVHEKIVFIDGAVSKTATIYDKNGTGTLYDDRMVSPATTKLLYEKYGYQFPVDTVIKKKYAPSSAKTGKRVRFPLPNPMPYHTSKGYPYSEAYYSDNGKVDIVVTFKEKDGNYKDFDKMKMSAADKKMLNDKYGYVFPEGHYPHLPPPPPPAAPTAPTVSEIPPPPPPAPPAPKQKKLAEVKLLPPPPPAPPAKEQKDAPPPPTPPTVKELPPPTPPAPPVGSTKIMGGKSLIMTIDSEAYSRGDIKGDHTPAIVVNGSVYDLKQTVKKGQQLIVSGSSGEYAVMFTGNDLQDAINKYGERAKNGVIFAYGTTSVQVK